MPGAMMVPASRETGPSRGAGEPGSDDADISRLTPIVAGTRGISWTRVAGVTITPALHARHDTMEDRMASKKTKDLPAIKTSVKGGRLAANDNVTLIRATRSAS